MGGGESPSCPQFSWRSPHSTHSQTWNVEGMRWWCRPTQLDFFLKGGREIGIWGGSLASELTWSRVEYLTGLHVAHLAMQFSLFSEEWPILAEMWKMRCGRLH